MTDAPEWFRDGLQFECTQCGNCCTGPPGWVWFERDEGLRIAERLGIDEKTFLAKYAHRVKGRLSLQEHKTEQGYDCIFLDRETVPGRAVCGIYEDRPAQCRTWPFWPENVKSRRAWNETRRQTPCPGMDQGTLYTVHQIRIERDATPE